MRGLILWLLLTLPTFAHGQQKSDEKEILLEFKTQLVLVPFRALDRSNRPVNDLKAEELRLYENGEPAQILSLQRSEAQPLSFALLLDQSGSMQPHLAAARAAASEFFEKALKPVSDTASVVIFQREVLVTQPLTSDQALLKSALSENSLILSSTDTLAPSVQGDRRTVAGTSLYAAIYIAVDEVLRPSRNRRVILLISDGFDSESGVDLREVLDYAWRNEVTIYAIGLGERSHLNREVLERLTAATGGRAFYPEAGEHLESIFTRIDEDLRRQYILSFYPNEQNGEAFRTIKLELPSRPLVTLSHRFGYYGSR